MIISYFITIIFVVLGCFIFYVDWIYGIIIILLAFIFFQLSRLIEIIRNKNNEI